MLHYTMSDSVKTLYAKLTDEVKKCEQLRIEGKAYAGKDEQLDVCKAQAREVNKAMMTEIIQAYVDLAKEKGAVAVMSDYMADWFFTGFKVTQDSAEDGGEVHVADTSVRIPFSAIDTASKTVKLTTNGAWRKYLVIFADNCVRFQSTNEKGEAAVYTKTTLPAELVEKRKQIGWEKCSKGALHEQMNQLVAMILPEEMRTFMLKSDVRDFILAMTKLKNASSMSDSNINFAVSNERALETQLFRHILTRRNNLATNFEIKFAEEKKSAKGGVDAATADGGTVSGSTETADIVDAACAEASETVRIVERENANA